MKDLFVLKLLDRISFLFDRFGVNYKVMRRILQIKLIMDQRRVPTIMSNNKNEGKNAYRSSLFIYAFIGLFIAITIFSPVLLFYKMNIVFGMIIFMVMTTMVSDFSTVLLDAKDKNILLPRPIDTRTVNASKIVHILIYLSSITMAISGFSMIAGTIKYGPGFLLLFMLALVLICGFVMFFTSILYFIILWFFDGEKLKDIINYFQIGLSIFMTVMYQFIGRIFEIANANITFTPKWWNFLIPSAWFSAPFSFFLEGSRNTYFAAMSGLSIIIPLLTFSLYLKVIIPYFERSLQKLNNHGEKRRGSALKVKRQRVIAGMVCYDKLEKTFFLFTQNMLANARKLKLSLYPSLAFSVIMPFIMIFSFLGRKESLAGIHSALTSSKYYLFAYFSAGLLSSTLMLVSRSESYKGAWIYRALPVEAPAAVLKGAVKAFIYKFVAPVYVINSLIFIAIYGIGIIPDMLLIFANMLVLMLFIYKFSKKELPFYKDFQYVQDGSNVGVVILSLVMCGAFAGVHYFLKQFEYGVTVNIAVAAAAVLLLWFSSFRITWRDISE